MFTTRRRKRIDDPYLAGTLLYGDDFGTQEIAEWFEDEREGYANLEGTPTSDDYGYRRFNQFHLYRHLPSGHLGKALGVGAAYGAEFDPLLDRLDNIVILEPSKTLRKTERGLVPIEYVEPEPSGSMPFGDATFDLVTCFGVLHHIPNVTYVVGEMARVLRPGGFALIREPIHSMGDWTAPRHGLTKRERGIPVKLLNDVVGRHFVVRHSSPCHFPLLGRVGNPDGAVQIRVDAMLARSFAWNYRYHATSRWEKIRPRSVALVLQRM